MHTRWCCANTQSHTKSCMSSQAKALKSQRRAGMSTSGFADDFADDVADLVNAAGVSVFACGCMLKTGCSALSTCDDPACSLK